MGKFINPFTDFGFKHIFGREMDKDILIEFLNDLLEGFRWFTMSTAQKIMWLWTCPLSMCVVST